MSLQQHLRIAARAASKRKIRPAARSFSGSTRIEYKKEETKDTLEPWSTEVSKSATDQDAAQLSETAHGKNLDKPEEAYEHSKSESLKLGQDVNPLEVSPANVEVSKTAAHGAGSKLGEFEVVGQNVPSSKGYPVKAAKGEKYRKNDNPQTPGIGAGASQ